MLEVIRRSKNLFLTFQEIPEMGRAKTYFPRYRSRKKLPGKQSCSTKLGGAKSLFVVPKIFVFQKWGELKCIPRNIGPRKNFWETKLLDSIRSQINF